MTLEAPARAFDPAEAARNGGERHMTGVETHPIWKEGAFRPEDWTHLAAEAAPSAGQAVLVGMPRFLDDPERFLAHDGPLGLVVAAGDDVRRLEPYLWRFALLALEFPKFSDGRSYSAARLLRERFGFKGEIRAFGDVLTDQIALMRRCGIDSFAVTHAPTRRALVAGRSPEVRLYYQPIRDSGEAPAGGRPWLRRPAA